MVGLFDTATVKLWNHVVGVITCPKGQAISTFEFDPNFLKKGIDISRFQYNIQKLR